MTVKDFLSVCDFKANRIIDLNGNLYFLNNRQYATFEDVSINKVLNHNGYIVIILDTYGYDGEYEKRVVR